MTVTSPIKVTRRLRSLLLMVSAIALVAVVVFASREVARTTSATWDETIYLYLGRQAVLANDHESFSALGVAPLAVWLAWSRAALEPIGRAHNDPEVYRQRVGRARANAVWWFAVPLVLSVLLWVGLRHGVGAGVVAAGLVALSPNIAAHASLATTDIAFTAIFVITLAALTFYLERPSWGSAGALAVSLGVALAVKYSALSLFICAVLLLVWHRDRRRLRLDASLFVASLVVAWALHGWSVAPLVTPDGLAVRVVERLFGWTGQAAWLSDWLPSLWGPSFVRGIAAQAYLERAGQEGFLLGQTSLTGWWYYFPVALSMKSTPIELAAFASFFALAIVRRGRDRETQVLTTAGLVFGVLALMGRRDLGIRYVLPLIVTAVIGAVVWINGRLSNRRLAAAAGVAALSLQGYSFGAIAPQHLAYFNVLAGGPAQGYTRLVDSNLDWGQDLPRLSEWQRARGGARIGVVYFGSAPLQAYGVSDSGWRNHDASSVTARPQWVVISVTSLQGIFLCGDPFAALRQLAPSDRIGYTMMVYAVDRPDVQHALAAARADSCAP